MGSLTTCMKKAGDKLDSSDRVFLHERAAALRKEGQSVAEAAQMAVDERLAEVRRLIVELDPTAAARFEAEDAAPEQEATGKIDDAGEKIGGSRKDRWSARGLDVSDLDSMAESEGATLATKANVWKPDYASIAQESDPVTAAMVKVVFDQLAAKPRQDTPQGRRDYVRAMQAVRKVYGAVRSIDEARDAWKALRTELGVTDRRVTDAEKEARRVLFSVYKGRADPFVYGYDELARAKRLVQEGFPGAIEPWTRRFVIRASGGPGTTEAGVRMYAQSAATAGTPLTAEQISAGHFEVRDKAGRAQAYLSTLDDAEQAAKALYEQTKVKEQKEAPERPHLDKLVREGLDDVIDRDVTPQDLLDAFGFRGVEWGNWSAQDERQRILNMAYDALSDLAKIMNVPRKAMSLDGTLGMAFGARGGGSFAAHYEPGKLVINMTKLRGGGSLAHEWAHALDHYLGELARDDAYKAKARGVSGWYQRMVYDRTQQKKLAYEPGTRKLVSVATPRLPNLRPELAERIDAVMQTLFGADKEPTQYAREAQKLSGKSDSGYWIRPTEMWARAFESYVFDRLVAMGAKSEYLVHGVEQDRYSNGERFKGNPYPTGNERAEINKAFDAFVAEMKTRDTDKGVAMFSRAPGAAEAWTTLAKNDDLFTFPKSDAKDMAGIVAESGVTLAVEPETGFIPDDIEQAWRVYPPGKAADLENRGLIIEYKDGRVEVNLSKFQRGDAGAQAYAVAGAYAHNNGLEFSGDRLGISDVGAARRLENMISLALKFGTTDFMGPHPEMIQKLGLDWRNGDSDHNLAEMLQASYRNATVRVPALQDLVYDPDTDSLALLSTGERVTDAEADRIAGLARAKGLSIGRRSLQRIALAGSFARATPEVQGAGLAGLVRAWSTGTVELPSSLRGILYSRDAGSTQGLTDAEAAAIMALPEATRNRLTGQRPTIEGLRAEVDKLTDWPRVSVANSVGDLPPAQRKNLSAIVPGGGVRGVYFPDTDHIWLFAEHLHSAAEAKFVLLHEAFHRGLAKTIGGDSARLLRQMYHTNGKLQKLAKQQMKAHKIGLDEAIEEALADLAGKGEARDLKGWAKLVDMIRGWLSDVGRVLGLDIKWTDDMVADFVAGAARAGLEGGAHVNVATDARLSRAEAAADGPQTAQGLVGESGGVFDFGRMGRTKQDRLRAVIDGSRPFWLGALTRDQIADIYGKDIPPVKAYDTLTRAMENQRSKIAQDADTIYSAWAKLDSEVNDRLGRVMLDATVHSVHPDGEFNAIKSNDAETEVERKKVHKRIRREFAELPKDAQAMYATVRDFHSGMLEQLKGSLEKRIERQVQDGKARAATLTSIREMFDKYKEHGPYFPLSRFGDYLVIGTRPDGERVVASYETAGEQQTAARALRKDGFTVKTKTAKEYSRAIDGSAGKFAGDVLTMLNDLDMAEASIGGKAADLKTKLMDDVNQLFIRALPDLSYRKHFAHRKNTPGFSSDVMRGFASSAFHAASHIARLNHADQMGFALEDAYKAIDQVDDGDFNTQTQVLNELAQRHDAAMNPNTHPIAAMLNQVGFVMYLGASPAAGLVNLLQTPMVTLPYLGAHFGFGKAAGAMAKATKDIMGAKANRQSGWDATQSDKLTQVERDTMRKLQDEGVIDLTQAHDLSAATGLDTGNVARSKAAFAMSRAMKIVGWTFHVPEVMNRQVTALTAYRLEIEKSGDQAKAEEAAREAIKRTHFDYSSSNRARFMQGNVARVLLQFKQYSQNMTYLLGRAAYQAMKGESPEVRAIARRQLVATLASTFVMAGALGLPGLGALAGAIGMMISGWDDDDKPWDWKAEFRNLMADTFGKEVGEVLSHGVPRALMPWDLSNRVGMGDMWLRSSDREGQNPREAFADDMKNILGPTAGTLLGLYTASDHMARGNWGKAAEAIVPKAIRDPLQASRMATEGVTSYNGEHLKDLTAAETVGKLLGFTPASVSEMYESRNAIKNAETAIMDKRKLLISRAARARMDGDKDDAAEAMAEIQAFNKRNPQEAINGEAVIQSIQQRRRHERQTVDGTYLPPKRDHLREVGRFAGSE